MAYPFTCEWKFEMSLVFDVYEQRYCTDSSVSLGAPMYFPICCVGVSEITVLAFVFFSYDSL